MLCMIGLAPLEVKRLLSQLIANGLFTLDELNDRLLNFNFGYSENDNPVPILSQCLISDTNKPLNALYHKRYFLIEFYLS